MKKRSEAESNIEAVVVTKKVSAPAPDRRNHAVSKSRTSSTLPRISQLLCHKKTKNMQIITKNGNQNMKNQ